MDDGRLALWRSTACKKGSCERGLDAGFYVKIALLGVLHWALAGMVLRDLARRNPVLGRRKGPWVVLVIFVAFLGSLLYLLCHPKVFLDEDT